MTSIMTEMDGTSKKKGNQSCSRWRLGRIFQIVVILPMICFIVICFSLILFSLSVPVKFGDMNVLQISDRMTVRCKSRLVYERGGVPCLIQICYDPLAILSWAIGVSRMRGTKPYSPIHISTAREPQLQQLVCTRTTLQVHYMRARIVLAAHDHPDWSN